MFGEYPLYLYHEAERSVESIVFYTTGFSSFFTASGELNTTIFGLQDDSNATYGTENTTGNFVEKESYHKVWIVGAILLLVLIVWRKKLWRYM